MAKKRVHEIAKAHDLASKDVLEKLQAAGVEVKTASSSVDEAAALRALGLSNGNGAGAPAPAKPAAAKPAPASPAAASPAAAKPAVPAAKPVSPAAARVPAAKPVKPVAPPPPPAPVAKPKPEPIPLARPKPAAPVKPAPPVAMSTPAAPKAPVAPKPAAAPAAKAPAAPAAPAAPKAPAPTGPKIITPEPPAAKAPAPAAAAPAAPASPAPAAPAASADATPAPTDAPAEPAGVRRDTTPPGNKIATASADITKIANPIALRAARAAAAAAAAAAPKTPAAKPAAGEEAAKPARRSSAPVRADGLVQGSGPRIIAQAPAPKKDSKAPAKPGEAAGGPGGRRRVVIDSQASRRAPGTGGPMQQPPRRQRRGRRRRGTYDDTVQPLDQDALTTTDEIKVNSGSTVKDVSEYLGVPVPDIIKKLMMLGQMATLTQTLADEAILVIAEEFDKKVDIVHVGDEADDEPVFDDDDADMQLRPAVVTIMGHVDHGKTSLLDAIREADVVAGEAGGITQHIGAYQVHHDDDVITFLDTPGHEAFTAMRARGARVTDIAVIVVAADDGAKPQTVEAIDHARAAGVPIIIAVNKIDKEGADPTRVRTELTQRDLQPAEWGGETEYVDVSAKTRQGLDDLLETISVVAELQDLKANPDAEASGVVIESKLDPGRGPVVTVLLQRGTLRVGDALVGGPQWGKVRAMQDYTGKRVKEAFPGDPVEILGFDGVPDAGEFVQVVKSDKEARRQATEREIRLKTEALARRSGRKVSFEEVFRLAQEGTVKELSLVLKADVSGSLEAFEDEIAKLPQDEVSVNIIRSGVGGINESDVMLAAASDAVILGFNVRPVGDARAASDREAVEIRTYSIIYKALDDLRDAMTGMLEPEEVEEEVGRVEVRTTFRASKIGIIAGCYVLEGKVNRGAKARLVRDGTVVHDGRISTLRRFNDDAREVAAGYECGITLENYQDVKEGDIVEVYATKQVERALS